MLVSDVFNEDCLIGIKKFSDKFFDLAIVDPPYGINADIKNDGKNEKISKNSLSISKSYAGGGVG